MWRQQLTDIAYLYSLVEDLQSFWQLKAMRWEALERRLEASRSPEFRHEEVNEPSLEQRLAILLNQDEDYRELQERISLALEETQKICGFLGIPYPDALNEINFSPPLMDNERIETAIEEAKALARRCQKRSYLVCFLQGVFHNLLKRKE